MPKIRLEDVRTQSFNLHKPNKSYPEFGMSASFRVDFDSEAEKKWEQKFEILESKITELHIQNEIAKAKENGTRIDEKQLRKETSLINPLRQASSGKKEERVLYDFKIIDFKYKKFADGMARKILTEEIIPDLSENPELSNHIKSLEDKLSSDKAGVATGALKMEAGRLRKLGKDGEADELINRCIFADKIYIEDGKLLIPQVIVDRDGKKTTTYTDPNTGEIKPNYSVAKFKKGGTIADTTGDLVDIIFEYKVIPSSRPGENNVYRVVLKLEEVIVKEPIQIQSSGSAPKYVDIDLSELDENVEKTVPSKTTSAKKVDEVDKPAKKETKKPVAPPEDEVTIPDIDDMLSDEELADIEIED